MKQSNASNSRDKYYREAESWVQDRELAREKSHRIAWIIASIATIVALFEAIAIVALVPLKTVVPYTLLVDRQTGYVEALKPLERHLIAPDRALTRSFLAQYVIAREGFDVDSVKEDYRKVSLWSTGEARDRYVSGMMASNPTSPLSALPRRAVVDVQIRSVSSLNDTTSLVRFTTRRTDPGAQPGPARNWVAVINYKFTGADMSADDRMLNPLGFQVVRYRRDAEALPEFEPGHGPDSGSPSALNYPGAGTPQSVPGAQP